MGGVGRVGQDADQRAAIAVGVFACGGWVAVPLVPAVPSVAGWRFSSLPRGLEHEHVCRLLAQLRSHDRCGAS